MKYNKVPKKSDNGASILNKTDSSIIKDPICSPFKKIKSDSMNHDHAFDSFLFNIEKNDPLYTLESNSLNDSNDVTYSNSINDTSITNRNKIINENLNINDKIEEVIRLIGS